MLVFDGWQSGLTFSTCSAVITQRYACNNRIKFVYEGHRVTEAKRIENSIFASKIFIGISRSLKHTITKFACTMGFCIMAADFTSFCFFEISVKASVVQNSIFIIYISKILLLCTALSCSVYEGFLYSHDSRQTSLRTLTTNVGCSVRWRWEIFCCISRRRHAHFPSVNVALQVTEYYTTDRSRDITKYFVYILCETLVN